MKSFLNDIIMNPDILYGNHFVKILKLLEIFKFKRSESSVDFQNDTCGFKSTHMKQLMNIVF